MKWWAYTDPDGSDWVSAAQVALERKLYYGRRPNGKTYYSTHKPGERYALEHIWPKKRRAHFAYKKNKPGAGGSGGESLCHRLFKDALSTVTHTRLLIGDKFYSITITHAETEFPIRTPDGKRYSIDVYLKFQSESLLDVKWNSELYLEVHHTHAVIGDKFRDLNALKLPLVEVDIPEKLRYRHENNSSQRQAKAYKDFIKRTLESPEGFIKLKLLCNPSSNTYARFDQILTFERKKNQKLTQELDEAVRLMDALGKDKTTLTEERNQALRIIEIRHGETSTALTQRDQARSEVNALKDKIQTLNQTVRDQRYWIAGLALLFIVSLAKLIYLAYW